MKLVQISHPYSDGILRQLPGSDQMWGDYKFVMGAEIPKDLDYWVILNTIADKQTVNLPDGHTLLWVGEPSTIYNPSPAFVKQFDTIITCQTQLPHPNLVIGQLGLPWFVNKNYDQLKAIKSVPKTKNISLITSNKQFTEGHRQRYQFAMALKEYFGDQVDLFGRGIQDFEDKWDVLAPYRFSVAIENSAYPHYFTEKISDCFLSYTIPLYYGCPNLDEYFDPASFVKIDLHDIERAKKQISQLLENAEDTYNSYLAALEDSRNKVLDDYNLFSVLTQAMDKQPQQSIRVNKTVIPEINFAKADHRRTQLRHYRDALRYKLRDVRNSVRKIVRGIV